MVNGYNTHAYNQEKRHMYQRDIPRIPETISRDMFVDIVFELGKTYQHGYDTIVAAVQIADYFLSFSGERIVYRPFSQVDRVKYRALKDEFTCNSIGFAGEIKLEAHIKKEQNPIELLDDLVPQVYSVELAHVVTVISAKLNEEFDHGYNSIRSAAYDTENSYVRKMEFEILITLGFHFRIFNFITVIGLLLADPVPPILGSVFWDISKEVCRNKDLLSKDPMLIVLSIVILGKRGKLRALKLHRERLFIEKLATIARELELPMVDVTRAYIKSHT